MDHYKSQYVRDFLKGLKEQDIGYTIIPLAAPDVTEVVSVVWRGLGGAPEIVLGGHGRRSYLCRVRLGRQASCCWGMSMHLRQGYELQQTHYSYYVFQSVGCSFL
jgi:hypothetical protein